MSPRTGLQEVVQVGRAESVGEGIVGGDEDGLADVAVGADAGALAGGHFVGGARGGQGRRGGWMCVLLKLGWVWGVGGEGVG